MLCNSCKAKGIAHAADESTHDQSSFVGDTVNQLSNNIMVIYQDSKNVYWFGSWESGLFKFDGKTLLNYTKKHGLPSDRVEEIKEDRHGNIFINTGMGLCKYERSKIVPMPETWPFGSNWALQADDLWFKSPKRGHVYRYDGKFLTNLEIPKHEVGEAYLAAHPGSSDPYGVYCIYRDLKGNIWFGMALMGALRYNGISFDWILEPDVTELHDGPSNGVRSIVEDKEGYFWFNSEFRYKVLDSIAIYREIFYERQKSIGSLDGNKDSRMTEYLSIAKDNDGDLWIATYRNGVWKYNGHKIRHYAVQENGKDINLFYIYKDNKGAIWLGTHENGVWKLDGEKFRKFNL